MQTLLHGKNIVKQRCHHRVSGSPSRYILMNWYYL